MGKLDTHGKSATIFFVDGADKTFADIILENRVNGETCAVASYGFGVKQINRLLDGFDNLLLLADESHAQLNKKAWDTVIEMDANLDHFTFKSEKTHAKLAIIDKKVIIFTSANLSANRRMESYMIAKVADVDGVDDVRAIIGNPSECSKKRDDDWFPDLGGL